MQTFFRMRDRRSTSLSVSSTSSNDSSPGSLQSSSNEKSYASPPPSSTLLGPTAIKGNIFIPNARQRLVLVFKIVATICAVFALCHYVFARSFEPPSLRFPAGHQSSTATKTESSIGDALPEVPTAFKVSYKGGYSKWTVSIPQSHIFPLQSIHYQEICRQSQALKEGIAKESRLVKVKDWRRKEGYYCNDDTFLEIDEAQRLGILPLLNQAQPDVVCERSLTFALDTEDASFGKSLLMLWLSYGLAKKEGRAFFIDDARWPYGQYASFFKLPPSPACDRPPADHIVPCPHSAKHLVVSAATLPWTFGVSFENEFLQLHRTGAAQSRRIYELLRTGYEDLFHLTGEDALYYNSRMVKLREGTYGSVIGMHLRRGDLHPIEHQFSGDYLPLERYATAAHTLLRSRLSESDADHFNKDLEHTHSSLLLASDDPEIVSSSELKEVASPLVIQKAQERIQLATKATLDLASPAESVREPGSAYVKHVDENLGWEGGFYNALFFAIGKAKNNSPRATLERLSRFPGTRPDSEQDDDTIPEQAIRMRELVGRAYLLVLAVLGESDGVVCAVSSATCRVLAVMMGWDAVKEGRWVNVDDGRGRAWSWDGRR